MPVSSGGMIAPFADEAMRLLRETWANPTMLAEEVFAILQQKIPQRASTLNVIVNDGAAGAAAAAALTMQQNGDGPFILMLDRFGHEVAQIDGRGKLRPADPAKNAPSRTLPTIIWVNPDDITVGTALDGTQLNALAVIPDTVIPIAGTYEYSPDSGTVLAAGNNQTLTVNFTPDNQAAYKRARKRVAINVTAGDPALINAGGFIDPAFQAFGSRTVPWSFGNCTAGSLIVVAIILTDDLSTFTVSDVLGNTYTSAGTPAHDGLRRIYIFYAHNNSSGANSVTVSTADALQLRFSIATLEFSGIAAVAPLLEAGPAPGDFSEQVEDPSIAPYPFNFVPVKVRSTKHDLVVAIVGSKSAIVTGFTPDTGFTGAVTNIGGVVAGKDPMQSFAMYGVNRLDGIVKRIELTAGGSGYSVAPTVSFTGGGGSGATATCTISAGVVDSLTLTGGGSGYTTVPTIVFTGTGVGAAASVVPTVTPRGLFTPSGDAYVDFAISFKQA